MKNGTTAAQTILPNLEAFRDLIALWTGQLPLARAFWEHAVFYGLLANVAATALSLSALALGLPGGVALGLHLLPLPYIVACVVGVLRSARNYEGPPDRARAAEIAVVVWAGVLVLI